MKIFYVDGYQIRQTLDTDFPIVASHNVDPTSFSPKFYIPPGETWVDHRFKKELDFLLSEEKAIEQVRGESYQERRKKLVENARANKSNVNYNLKTAKKDQFIIVYVDGAVVRRNFDPEFIFGGHGLVYKYVPPGEIWLDFLMDRRDLKHVLLHEITEINLMLRGKNYDIAHEFATAAERESRRKSGGRYPGDYNYPSEWTAKYLRKTYIFSSEKK